jgi:hypothetical protein
MHKAELRAFSLTSALLNVMLIWWRSEQRILLWPGDLDRGRFFRDTLGLAIAPAKARDTAWPQSMPHTRLPRAGMGSVQGCRATRGGGGPPGAHAGGTRCPVRPV